MPCYQPSSLPAGVTTTGRTGYATEADCLAACKEGACCEGTTCSVKPQCQCVPSGVCCGPDTTTASGVPAPRCRSETQAQCAQRGGTWVVGGNCVSDEKTGLAGAWCSTLTGGTANKVFKGVGTVCSPNPCFCCNEQGYPKSATDCAWCWCFCGEGAAPYPRFVNVSLSGTYQMVQPIFRPVLNGAVFEGFRTKTKSLSGTVTLSAVSSPSRLNCPNWTYGGADSGSRLPLGSGGAVGGIDLFLSDPSPTSVSVSCLIYFIDISEDLGFSNPDTWATFYTQGQPAGYPAGPLLGPQSTAGPYASGTCLSAMAGMTHEIIQEPFSITVVVNAVQA